MLLVKAGAAVDAFIDKLVPLLDKGDIIIDGGNSEYQDSRRRCSGLAEKGILFVGSGVSGGEEGARYGPSLMPGGNPDAWPHIRPIFQVLLWPARARMSQNAGNSKCLLELTFGEIIWTNSYYEIVELLSAEQKGGQMSIMNP